MLRDAGAERPGKGVNMEGLCEHCEYGNRFIDLGKCPECDAGRIVGDLHTGEYFCSNLHRITSVAVDFCGKMNCCDAHIFREHKLLLTSELTREQLIYVSRFIDKTPVQIYKSLKEQSSFCANVDFYCVLKIGRYLYRNDVSFRVLPEMPLLYKFAACFPAYADDYEWVLEKYHKDQIAN